MLAINKNFIKFFVAIWKLFKRCYQINKHHTREIVMLKTTQGYYLTTC